MKRTVVDLFCGCGGFSRGFLEEGFDIVLGIDIDVKASKSFSENFPKAVILRADIREIHGGEISKVIGEPPDVVIGSPPCEPFTPANPKRMENELDRLYTDEIGILTLHFIRLVGELNPKIFIMENVPQLVEGELDYFIRWEFSRIGYKEIYLNILRAEQFDTPSIRKRLFISNIPIKLVGRKRRINVEDALKGLEDPMGIISCLNHEITPISERKLKKIARLKWGDSLITFKGANGKFYRNWIRLHPKRVAPTVMGGSRFIHPYENRLLTVREQARLMGFPDDHVFYGKREEQYNQVGEAVPPTVSRAIAKYVKKYLEKVD
ncbi:MAG: DNA cytosine methyltransferase [Candidatus Methanomethylicia archaeon]